MRRTPDLLALLALLSWSPAAWADQLQCNTKEIAEQATRLLPEGSLVIDYCSLCETSAQVVRVERVSVVQDCEFEVELGGPVLAATTKVFTKGYEPGAPWAKHGGRFQNRLDLAYVYVEVARNDFRYLGGELGLKAEVNTRALRLPEDLYNSLGTHPLPVITSHKVQMAVPSPEAIRQVYDYYQEGQGQPPILVDLVPCLEVDNKKDSDRRYECVQRVTGPIDKSATLLVWTTWLVPKGDEVKDLTVQFLHEGVVRMTKDLSLTGTSLRTRSYTGTKLAKPGTWTVVVKSGNQELGRRDVMAR